jgi:hypothetical protein
VSEALGVRITLPLPPNMANSRMHWAVKNKKRVKYFADCAMAALLSAKGGEHDPKRWEAPAHVIVRATIYCGGKMDHDNAIARLKWPIDWMVRGAYLVGDKPEQLIWIWPITQVVVRDRKKYRVEFWLEAA